MAITIKEYNTLQVRAAKIFGTGGGEFGYGQSVSSAALPTSGTVALLADFQELRNDIVYARYHQIGYTAVPPISDPPAVFSTTWWTNLLKLMTTVETSKLVSPPSTQATRAVLSTEATTENTWNSTSTHYVSIQFNDADHMRYFFNTGSAIEFSAATTVTAVNAKSTAWNTLLAGIGVVSFRRNLTSSTKSLGTTIGFSKLTSTDQVIFEKTIASTPSPLRYTITANLDAANFVINFTVSYTNSGVNVSSILRSNVNAYYATGSYVSVDMPSAAGDFIAGLSDPTFALSRSVTSINEGEVGVEFTINTTNFADSLLYWAIIGTSITASDFTPATLSGNFSVENGTGSFTISAAADFLSENREQFNVQIRTDNNPKSPVVAQLSSLEIITDTSLTPPTATYTFLPLTTTSVTEGESVTYRIITTNVVDGTELTWSTKAITPTLSASDFVDSRLTGTVTIYNNTATIVRTILVDTLTEVNESYQIVLSTTNPTTGALKAVQTSGIVTITDAVTIVPDVPYVVTTDTLQIPEDSVTAVTFTVMTPNLPPNTKLYWKAVTDTGVITAADFADRAISGSVVVSRNIATVVRKAKNDNLTEGNEAFHLSFYTDSLMTKWVVDSDPITIAENVPYVLTRTPATMEEGSTGVTFALTTPSLPNGTILFWTTVSALGTVNAADFTDNAIDGTVTVMNNTGTILRRTVKDNLVEGTEQFYLEIRETAGLTGPVLVSSQTTSITETVSYEIIPQSMTITEGQPGVEFIVRTPFLPDGTILYWDTATATGSITASDFIDNKLSGTVTITNNAGTITRTAIVDNFTEGNESFFLILKRGTASSTKVATSSPVTVAEDVPYTIVPTLTTVIEGRAGLTFNITTPKLANGTKVYWTTLRHAGNITGDDFIVSDAQSGSAQRLTGFVVILNNTGSFVLTGRSDGLTEGNETFQIELRIDSVTGPVRATTELITLEEIVPYQIVPNVLSVNEGSSVSFTVTTPYLIDGTTLYWTTFQNSGTVATSDFTDDSLQGTVVIKNNTGSIIRTIKSDLTTELGVDGFSLQLRKDSYTSAILVTSTVVTIGDTSITPEVIVPDAPTYSVTPDKTTIVEGETVVFTIITENVAPTDNLFWTLFKGPGLTASSLVPNQSPSAINIAYDNPGTPDTSGQTTVTIVSIGNSIAEADRAFIFELRTGSVTGTVVATSAVPVRIVDPTPYRVYADNLTIVEGSATGVTFTVTTPAAAYGTNLKWTVVPEPGSSITYQDFAPAIPANMTDIVAINSSGTGTFTLTAAANSPVEGNESFRISLSTEAGTPLSLGVASPIVTIVENIPYLLNALVTSVQEGSSVEFTFSTPKLLVDTSYTWTAIGKSVDVSSSDFSTKTGTIVVPSSTSTKTFSVTATSDGQTEGDEQFYLEMALASTGQLISLGSISPTITITENVSYTVTPTASSVQEGGVISFNITTPKLPLGTVLNCSIVPDVPGAITSSDFYEHTMGPTVAIPNGISGKLDLTTIDDKQRKGNRPFLLRVYSPQNATYDSTKVTITDPPEVIIITPPANLTWLLTGPVDPGTGAAATTVVEGIPISFKLAVSASTTTNRLIGWTVNFIRNSTGSTPPGNNVTQSGQAILSANSATVTFSVPTNNNNVADVWTEINLSVTCDGVAISCASPTIRVVDAGSVTVGADKTTMILGSSDKIKFTITAPSYDTVNVYKLSVVPSAYWNATTFSSSTADVSVGMISNVTNRTGSYELILNPSATNTTVNQPITITVSPQGGAALSITYPTFTIVPADVYTISVNNQSINETPTNNTAEFTITFPPVNSVRTLYWTLKGLDATAFDSTSPLSKAILANQTSTTFLFTAKADATTNVGTKQFWIDVSFTSGGPVLPFVAPCPKVTINDTSQTPLPVLTVLSGGTQITMPETSSSSVTSANTIIVPFKIDPMRTTRSVNWEIISSSEEIKQSLIDGTSGTTINAGIVPTDPTGVQGTLTLTAKFRSAIKQSGTFQVRFTDGNNWSITNVSGNLTYTVIAATIPPPSYTQTMTVDPIEFLTTATTKLTISGDAGNTGFTLTIDSDKPCPTTGTLSLRSYNGTLTNGGFTATLGPWSAASSTASITAKFADGKTKTVGMTITEPPKPTASITILSFGTPITVGGSSISVVGEISSISSPGTVSVWIVEASSSNILVSVGANVTTTLLTTIPATSTGTNTYKCTATISATTVAGVLANGTFKVKMSFVDPNYNVGREATTGTITFTVPVVYDQQISITPASRASGTNSTLSITGGNPGSAFSIAVVGTGSIASNANFHTGTLSSTGTYSNTALYGGLGAGTGTYTATFKDTHTRSATLTLTDSITTVTVRYDNSGYVAMLPNVSIKSVTLAGGSGGKGYTNVPSGGDVLTGTIPLTSVPAGGTFCFIAGMIGGDYQTAYIGGVTGGEPGYGGDGQKGVSGWGAYASGAGGGASSIMAGAVMSNNSIPLAAAAGGGGGGGDGDDTSGSGGKATTSTSVATALSGGEDGVFKSGDVNTGGAGGGGGGCPGGLCGNHGNSSHDGSGGGNGGCSYVPSGWTRSANANSGDGYVTIVYNVLNSASTEIGTFVPRGTGLKSVSTPGTTTWTVPANKTSISVIVVGAGGGGGAGNTTSELITGTTKKIFTTIAGYGGGGGGYSFATYTVTPGTVVNITVPAGGTGAVDLTTAATAGGTASISFGSTTLSANGGQPATTSAGGAGGAGNTRAGATGGTPQSPLVYNQQTMPALMTALPSAPDGASAAASGASLTGAIPLAYGNGGAGASPTGVITVKTYKGSNGSNGYVKITY